MLVYLIVLAFATLLGGTMILSGYPRTGLLFALLALVFGPLVFLVTPSAAEDTYYRYELPNGTIGFTDSSKRIPTAGEAVSTFTMEEVRDNTDKQVSVVVDFATPHFFTIPEDYHKVTATPLFRQFSIEKVRVQLGDRNVPMYRVSDAAGNVVSETRQNPIVYIQP